MALFGSTWTEDSEEIGPFSHWLEDNIDDTDNYLLYYYRKGFNDELNGIGNMSNMELKAYILGRQHALIGDDVSSIDLLTEEEILKQIKY